MSSTAFGALGTVAGILITVLGTIIVTRMNRGTSRENQMIDQLQEDNKDLRERVEKIESRERALVAYVLSIHQHFAEGNPPPPPPLPRDLSHS